jgi:hypothetical protein
MNNIVKIFNKLIQYKVSPHFGEVLLDCKLIGRNGGIGDYRYDLLFIFDREYNNPKIQLESVLQTCDDLFNWVDLRDLPNLSIVIMNKFGRNQHYSYFELMDEICESDRHYQRHMISNHPKYYEYKEWRRNKELEEIRRRVWEKEMGRVTRNDLIQQTRMVESKKKKFLFW